MSAQEPQGAEEEKAGEKARLGCARHFLFLFQSLRHMDKAARGKGGRGGVCDQPGWAGRSSAWGSTA